MNYKTKNLSVVALILASCFAAMTPVSAEPTNSPNRLVMCVRKTWASTDKCKDPAVASKNAPKDLKKEIERLADLIVISLPLAKTEAIEQSRVARAGYLKNKKSLLLAKQQADDKWETCLKGHGLKSSQNNPKNFCSNEFLASLSATARYIELSNVSNTDAGWGRYFDQWLSAWESLATLAKTFPQHIQPNQLTTLLNAYDNIKSCQANKSCGLPK